MEKIAEWQLRKSIREYLAIAIVLSIGYTALNDPYIGAGLLSNLGSRNVQYLLIFSVSAFLFSYGLLNKEFKEWTFWAGVSGIPVGLGLAVSRVGRVIENTDSSLEDKILNWAILGIFPVVVILVMLGFLYLKQSISIGNNSILDRALGVVGLVLTLIMFWGQYLPWNRQIYSATNSNWQFTGSGSQVYIRECCYLIDYGWTDGLKIVIPLISLLALFVLKVLGFKISNLGFLGLILWGGFEIVNLLDEIGFQDPVKDAGWTSSEVSSNGLTFEIELMFGGYLFMGAFIGLVITLLLPRVLNGREG